MCLDLVSKATLWKHLRETVWSAYFYMGFSERRYSTYRLEPNWTELTRQRTAWSQDPLRHYSTASVASLRLRAETLSIVFAHHARETLPSLQNRLWSSGLDLCTEQWSIDFCWRYSVRKSLVCQIYPCPKRGMEYCVVLLTTAWNELMLYWLDENSLFADDSAQALRASICFSVWLDKVGK